MSEMLDRVAMAIMDARQSDQDSWGQAHAAIEAMREPTDEMWDACEEAKADFETGIAWPVMIDAALSRLTAAARTTPPALE